MIDGRLLSASVGYIHTIPSHTFQSRQVKEIFGKVYIGKVEDCSDSLNGFRVDARKESNQTIGQSLPMSNFYTFMEMWIVNKTLTNTIIV